MSVSYIFENSDGTSVDRDIIDAKVRECFRTMSGDELTSLDRSSLVFDMIVSIGVFVAENGYWSQDRFDSLNLNVKSREISYKFLKRDYTFKCWDNNFRPTHSKRRE
jgi:hypothetical protein